MGEVPRLTGDAKRAVEHRGSHIQIIAAAGAGKTEVVSQRVASLLAEGVPATAIVAFTFTERAAAELKNRIALRAEQRIGADALNLLGGLSVGTIHSYCFRFLQQRVAAYETYDVLDENQLNAFVGREAKRLDIVGLTTGGRYRSIKAFLEAVDVVENELLDPDSMPDPFGTVLRGYHSTLDRYRLLTYGQQIVRAVKELERPEMAAAVHGELRHLIVDEYQDVNPAQEQLVELLAGPGVELCVVGDDDQAIYQWRGSDVSNIVTFAKRYPNVEQFEIVTNRRSRPSIIKAANRFATTIPDRIPKKMKPFRDAAGDEPEIAAWSADTELDEAGWIAEQALRLNDQGVPFRDIAVLVRGSVAYRKLMEQFATFGIPVQPAGRTGLFEQPEAVALGKTICWLRDLDWRAGRGQAQQVDDDQLIDEYLHVFDLEPSRRRSLRGRLNKWKELTSNESRTADLVGELYELLEALDVRTWDLDDPLQVNRLGTLARFTALLADYESVRRRARPDADVDGEQVGGERGGPWYYWNLGIHILNYANDAYEGFDGEPDFDLDAIDLTTVHRAKGLEWPVVFVPSLTANRFPSSKSGSRRDWLVPREMFAADRYEGGDPDERRLFYVAITRARDWLSLSRHARPNTRAVAASPYFDEMARFEIEPDEIEIPEIEIPDRADDEPISLTFSELAQYLDCGMEFRLRNLLGFQPRLAPELGYGKAVHHVLRTVALQTQERGNVPTAKQLDHILDASFFLPIANKVAHRQLKEAAKRLVHTYATQHADDLHRVWETERPFELHLDGVIVNGRADVILDEEGGRPASYAILDYKTSTGGGDTAHDLQLQIYADAGRREGLDVQAAYVHDLKAGSRGGVDVSAEAISHAEAQVIDAAKRLRVRDYAPSPGRKCRTCEVRTVCSSMGR